MLRDVGADDSLPALDMENLPVPAHQPITDADRDADQHSSDELMDTGEAAEDALPLTGPRLTLFQQFVIINMFG